MMQDAFIYTTALFHFQGVFISMLEPYYIFNGYSEQLYDENGVFRRARSVYFFEKYEQPIHTLLHKPSWDTFGTEGW